LTRALRGIALLVAVTLAGAACARTPASGAVSPAALYASTIQLADIAPVVGDSSNWWPAPPTFGVRPLDISTLPDQERYEITVRFTHSGTPEGLQAVYRVWDSAATATAVMSSISSAFGTSLTGPKAGDQILYYNQQQQVGAAPYNTETLIRVGQTEVILIWNRTLGFASTTQSGQLAARVVLRLNQVARVRPSPSPDSSLLPPFGPDLTLLGTAQLPVEATAALLDSPSPEAVSKIFSDLGIHDFVYGDYTLDDDTHMEVRSAAFTFSSAASATTWINNLIGASSLDQSGAYFNFDQATEQYVAAFTGGAHGVLMICKSSADFEAASRSCELPMSRVIGAWRAALGG
jgi:hypothetical protein